MTPADRLLLHEIATGLDSARREGADIDQPEGSRRIWLSDTVATKVAAYLRRIAVNS
jgi:hypothetical protein